MGTSTYSNAFRLLIVDDDPAIQSAVRRIFMEDGYFLMSAGSAEDALNIVARQRVDAAVLDLKMPGMDGLQLLELLREKAPGVRVMMLTGHGSIGDAVAAIKLGAVDFLEKPLYPDLLRLKIRQISDRWALEAENVRLQSEIAHKFDFSRMIGHSQVMLALKRRILQVAGTDVTVLIQGETGTGKELVAHAIHQHSRRSNAPFQNLDCTGMNESIIESELFGHVKGAFTGAVSSKTGIIRSAHGGTLFFDEIGELPIQLQSKLLRVMQEQKVRPLGSHQEMNIDARILAATNRDLAAEMTDGKFRKDLFYRLNVVTITVPPLRHRTSDIPMLIDCFLKRLQTGRRPVKRIGRETLDAAMAYPWPGNVRQLENAVTKAFVLTERDVLQPEDLLSAPEPTGSGGNDAPSIHEPMPLSQLEELAIKNALAAHGGNRKATAKSLKISEATLYRKLKRYVSRPSE
jgi:DNA-binding NtrC family response regulator